MEAEVAFTSDLANLSHGVGHLQLHRGSQLRVICSVGTSRTPGDSNVSFSCFDIALSTLR